jgi:hypothetical protein
LEKVKILDEYSKGMVDQREGRLRRKAQEKVQVDHEVMVKDEGMGEGEVKGMCSDED